MDLEIVPEPTSKERRAIVVALRLEEAEEAEPTQWRRVGLELSPEDDQAAAPVRQTRGAARA